MSSYNTLRTDLDDGVCTLTLHRPDQLNAFTVEMAEELEHFFRTVNADDTVQAIVVTGAGRAFCAGMDLSRAGNVFGLNEGLEPTLEDLRTRLTQEPIHSGVRDTGGRVTLAIYDCTKPVIAAINGAAVGIGATMTLAMDVRMVSQKARVGFVFGKLGIVPEACSSWFLPRLVGISQALEWVYTADILEADELLRGRYARSVHAPDDLLGEAQALARRFVSGRSPVATALARQMLYRNAAQPHPRAAHEVDSLAMFYLSREDGKEGVQAFLDKRPATFSRRASQDLPPFYADWLAE